METVTHVLVIMTVVLTGVALYAWRSGNEKRDVALLGSIAGALGVATVGVVLG